MTEQSKQQGWARTPPTEPGLYWFWARGFETNALVVVRGTEGGLSARYYFDGGRWGALKTFRGTWFYPPVLYPPGPTAAQMEAMKE